MAHCLLCFDQLPTSGWQAFLLKGEEQIICQECMQKFERLEGKLCSCCGRSLLLLEQEHQEKGSCFDCLRWEAGTERGVLMQNRSLYVYNAWGKEVLARYKFRGDAILFRIFQKELQRAYRLFPNNCRVIAVPLSAERLYERGFNQAELLAACLPGFSFTSLIRLHTEKQSKKTRQERMQSMSPFSFVAADRFDGENILLIDDVYTTGTTLRQIGRQLQERGADAIYALTLFRG